MKRDDPEDPSGVRIDKWLWCARFFKSRSLAAEAVSGGLVQVNGERVKPSRLLRTGDHVRVTRDDFRTEIVVLGMPHRRGPASEARSFYEETAESIAARERRRELARLSGPAPDTKPDKHARRSLRELKQRDE